MTLPLKLALAPLLLGQAAMARWRMPRLPEAAGERSGSVGCGAPLRLLIAGDSSAAGVGAKSQRQALAGQLTTALAQRCSAQVQWQLVARSGLTTADLLSLLEQQPPGSADVAVIVTGVNDVVTQVPPQIAVEARERLLRWLLAGQRARHAVFTALPPLHQFVGLPQPLRWIAGEDARRHDAALENWAATRAQVSLLRIDLPIENGMLARDGFHPGPAAYRACGAALAEHLATSVWSQLRATGPG